MASRKSLYLSQALFKGKSRGNSRGKVPDKRDPEEDLENKEISLLKEAFDIMDTNSTGALTKKEVEDTLEVLKYDTSQVAYRLLSVLQKLPDEKITFDTFKKLLNRAKGNCTDKLGIQRLFDLIENGDGKITAETLERLSFEVGVAVNQEIIEETLRQISPDDLYMTSEQFYKIIRSRETG
jgi:Ca2+-binding EF-hand superfamily protein